MEMGAKRESLLYFRELGQGTPLLMIHGGLSNSDLAWRMPAEELSAYHRLILVDRRGHGRSPSASRYTIEGDAEDILEVLDHLQLDTVHLVGHSYGAVVVLQIACKRPAVVKTLHLIEPPLLRLAVDEPAVARLRDESIALWRRAPHLSAEQVVVQFLTSVAGAEFVAMIRTRPVWQELVTEARRLPLEENPAEKSPALLDELPDCPVALYTGGRSHPALRIVAERVAERITGARLFRFADAYHEVHKVGAPFVDTLLSITGGSVQESL